MAQQRLGIIMNGVTGRMGMNQHLIRSIVRDPRPGRRRAARTATRVMPDPILVGRNAAKLAQLAKAHGVDALDHRPQRRAQEPGGHAVLRCRHDQAARQAAAARRSRPARTSIARSRPPRLSRMRSIVARAAKKAGIRHGVVQDKLFLPGLLKLKTLIDSGFFGRILSVRGEFGYWVFEGDWQPAQRPSWNYRKKDGGGIILDMLCHWRYVLDNLFGEVEERLLPRRDPYPQALGRERQALQGRRRRRRLCHVPARRRRHRAHQHLLVHARAARRPRHLPCRRHARLGGGRPAEMLEPGAGEHAAAGVESGRAAADQILRDLGGGARTAATTTTASRPNGRCSSAISTTARRSSGRWWKAPRACSWPRPGSRAGRSGAGSTSRR